MKRYGILIAVLAVIGITITAVFIFEQRKIENLNTHDYRNKGESEHSKVNIYLKSNRYPENVSAVRALWVNQSRHKVFYGEMFTLYKLEDNKFVEVPYEEPYSFAAVLNILNPIDRQGQIYYFSRPLSKGHYRLSVSFDVGKKEKDLLAYVEFDVG